MEANTIYLQSCLDRLRAGEVAARDELIGGACERLTRLARKMLRADGRLRRWEETDDVLQTSLLRLHRALGSTVPGSPREFFRLAALQIRRELIDLARHYYGPEGAAAHHDTQAPQHHSDPDQNAAPEPADHTLEPGQLARWTEFHAQIDALPEDERDVFDLVWYQGLTHADAAALLQVSTKTVQRRWQAACLRLHDALGGEMPGL